MTHMARLVLASLVCSVWLVAGEVRPADPGSPMVGVDDRFCTRAEYGTLMEHEGIVYGCHYLPDPRTFVWQLVTPREPPPPDHVPPPPKTGWKE